MEAIKFPKMGATVFEFKHRDIIIRLIYLAAVLCYLFDPAAVGTRLSPWLSQEIGGFSEIVWKRAIFSAGVALVLIAASLRTWATAYLRYDVMRNPKIHTDRLICGGPYGYVRNPLYVGNLLMVAGVSPMLSPSGMVVLIVGSLLFVHRLVLREEAELARTHSASFGEYCRTVPRWAPSLRRRVEAAECTPSLKNGLIGELLLWIIAIALAAYVATFDLRVFGMIFACAFIPGATRRIRRMLRKEDA